MLVLGIDPGLKGGVAFLEEDKPVLVAKMPVLNRVVDVIELVRMIDMMGPAAALIERQSILANQGGAMTIGANYGRLLAALELNSIPYKEVTPASWKKRAGIAPGVKGKAKQEAAFEAARREFGNNKMTEFSLRPQLDGPVEAMLIALFGA